MVGVGHGGGGHSWASSILGLWASLIFPSSSIAWLEGREGTHLCLAWCVPSPGALGWTRRSSKPDWESVQTGSRGATLGPALAQGATEAQKEDCVASGGCSYPDLAQHDHGPQPRKLNSRGLAADLDRRGHCWRAGSSLAPPGDVIDLARWGFVCTLLCGLAGGGPGPLPVSPPRVGTWTWRP